jgi:hypothetical protein
MGRLRVGESHDNPFMTLSQFQKYASPRDWKWFSTSFFEAGYGNDTPGEVMIHFYECRNKYMSERCAEEMSAWYNKERGI